MEMSEFFIAAMSVVVKPVFKVVASMKSRYENAKKSKYIEKRGKYFKLMSIKKNKNRLLKVIQREYRQDLSMIFSAFNDRFNYFKPLSLYNLNSSARQDGNFSHTLYHKTYLNFHKKIGEDFSFGSSGSTYKEEKDFISLLNDDNRVKYIIGEIGCGKSTFISHLLYCATDEIVKRNKNIAVICVNCSKDKIEKYIVDQSPDYELAVFKLLEQSFREQFKDVEFKDINTALESINKHFKNHKLTIIFDNLDKVYDESATLILRTKSNVEAFKKHYNNKKYHHFSVSIFHVIKNLLEKLSQVNFILALRPETHNALNNEYRNITGAEFGRSGTKNITIDLLNSRIDKILYKRFDLIDSSAKEEKQKLLNVSNDKEKTELLNFSKAFAKESFGIKINGNRHIISNLRELSNAIEVNSLFYPKWLIQIYVYLDGLERYSQTDNSGICNIFLINIDYRSEIDPYHEKWIEETKRDHFHTYWLKYLICRHFANREEGELLDAAILNKNFTSYELEILNFCLYSLSEVNHGKLLICDYAANSNNFDDYVIQKTKRLSYCLEKEIFFSFSYLAVIVDDPWLEFPILEEKAQKIMDDIFKPYTYTTFFCKNDAEWQQWLFQSIKKVFIFISILEMSLVHYESKRIKDKEVCMPNFSDIKQKLENEVKNIAQDLNIENNVIVKKLKDVEAINKKIQPKIQKFFKRYYKYYQKSPNLRKPRA